MAEQPEQSNNTISSNLDDLPMQSPVSAPMPVVQATKVEDDPIIIQRTTLNYIVIAAVFFAVGMLIGAVSFGSSVDSEAIEAAVESVLIDAGIMQAPADMEILVDDDPFLGAEDAPIVIVEFSAYACPYCGRHFEETLQPLLDTYGEYIRYVYRDFPSINPNVSFPASLAANCALEQDMFWEYHELLFLNQNTLAQSGQVYLMQLASDLGLDTVSFDDCLTQQDYLAEVNADFDAGIAVGVTGTPSFYINGQAHSGARPFSYFEAIILRELEAAGIDPSS
ncbi:MAG: thioredoxin domain-containing protein [Phototrophicaceae bacterium]